MLYFFMALQTFLASAIFLRTHFRVYKKDVTRLLLWLFLEHLEKCFEEFKILFKAFQKQL